ncbi:unnamed protein product, partial [Ectocarpus sp. 12 AP-2014]
MQDKVLNKESEGEQDADKARLGSGGTGVTPGDGVEAGKRAGSGAGAEEGDGRKRGGRKGMGELDREGL